MKNTNQKTYLYIFSTILFLISLCFISSCDTKPTSDEIQKRQEENILKEGTAQTGMPAIVNFRERKLLKDILEMRDQNITTYTYLYNEMQGKLVFFGESVGFGIPYATQYTSPERTATYGEMNSSGNLALPQADPNGLFSPASAEGTWILLKNPHGTDVKPVYVEPRIIVSSFKLDNVQ